ncbi:hypothetical protein CR194_06935 [Salipaludibacillus keqinensis]|uniref:Uncharacterized protein n=1 Tax=Salipaludibacillus keqinensis TaxID=2045207 RepID=A0A323TJF2_9BACI|nr:hypothetical protein [Salipaludibacillus keqinensis]PYZ95242.1 hypothetical protein CR194_06935 [Salipaludibacillus keqinensis]
MWLALVKKEWQESTFRFLVCLALLTIVYVFIYTMMATATPLVVFIGVVVVLLHVFYLFLTLLASLIKEWKEHTSHLWMNLPVPGWKLLSAKVAIGFSQFMILIIYGMVAVDIMLQKLINLSFAGSGIDYTESLNIGLNLYRELSPWIVLMISQGALQLGLAALFIFVFSKVIRPFGWLIAIIITFAANHLLSAVKNTEGYQTITQWVPLLDGQQVHEKVAIHLLQPVEAELNEQIIQTIYLGQVVAEVLFILVVFWMITWLFDQKAEL